MQVSLYQPKPDPDPLQGILAQYSRENTLVLRELPALVTDAHLALYIEMVTNMMEDDYNLDRRGDTALMKLSGSEFKMQNCDFRALAMQFSIALALEYHYQ